MAGLLAEQGHADEASRAVDAARDTIDAIAAMVDDSELRNEFVGNATQHL